MMYLHTFAVKNAFGSLALNITVSDIRPFDEIGVAAANSDSRVPFIDDRIHEDPAVLIPAGEHLGQFSGDPWRSCLCIW